MKNRLFPIIIGLCFVSLIGVAFFTRTTSENRSTGRNGKCQTHRDIPRQGTEPAYGN